MKVLFHIDEYDKWDLTQANVRNILKEDANIKVSVVANAEAVDLFIHERALVDNVNYYVCNNALTARSIPKEKLIKGVEVTSSDVYKILLLQEEGYKYIKP